MSPLSDPVVWIFSTLTLIGQILAGAAIILWLIRRFQPKDKTSKKLAGLLSQNYVAVVLVVSAIATMGSLTFSEVLGFVPCKLCWYQRIAMYPITLISLIGLVTNDLNIKKYIMPLALIGLGIAGYHILVQTFPAVLECSDEVAKCSAVEFAKFGYITIPVMSFTAFAMILIAGIFKNNSK